MSARRRKRGFKVVFERRIARRVDGCEERILVSAAACHRSEVVYKVGKPAVPQSGAGPLCIFATLRAADEFATSYDGIRASLRIFACRYLPSAEKAVWFSPGELPVPLTLLPTGTALADEVTLLSKSPKEGR